MTRRRASCRVRRAAQMGLPRWRGRDGRVFADRLDCDVYAAVDLPGWQPGVLRHQWRLVPQDINGKQDVYEWEREGSGSCREGTYVAGVSICSPVVSARRLVAAWVERGWQRCVHGDAGSVDAGRR